jgi:hypothetical protein
LSAAVPSPIAEPIAEAKPAAPRPPWRERLARGLRFARDTFPLTPAGCLLLGGALWALLGPGLGQHDLVLLILGVLGVLVTALSALLVGVAALLARSGLPQDPVTRETEAGRWTTTGFSAPSLWFLPMVGLTWRWDEPAGEVEVNREGGRLIERVRLTRRGEWPEVRRAFEVEDAFGLASIRFFHVERGAMRALPNTGRLRDVQVVQGLAGGDDREHPLGPAAGDLMDIRRYGPGDPLRFVLWKLYAKSGQLLVRTPERAIAPIKRTVAYLVVGQDDEAAAGAARVAVGLAARSADWAFGADGCHEVARDHGKAEQAILSSGKARPEDGAADLSRFLDAASFGAGGRALVFVPGVPGPWMRKVVEATAGRFTELEFAVCVDGLKPPKARSWLSRALLSEGDDAQKGIDTAALVEVVSTLTRARARVTVLDREGGVVVPSDQLYRLKGAAP